MTKIKYCGLTTEDDVKHAIEAGVDAVGFVFVPSSPRRVSVEVATNLISMAKASGLTTVALFANQDADKVNLTIGQTKADVLQFHGEESAEYCEQFMLPYWKAIPMLSNASYTEYMASHPNAAAYLLDAFDTQQSGGSGKSFNWFEFPIDLKQKMILAGGLNEQNIAAALAATGSQYVDTSSGIESSPGVKSKAKMLSFANTISAIDHNNKN
ncbi:phosphoribosylanthranilate isomerase [Marinicella litoralis]|uniref:N-(5'-phosphoribosyl)anthranilate isomerase n=1 Tax=Marinicella litoralis TaxID=644220 RepID=A0A4R6XW76_9GAMM|nr:phosphoribosylanthranilate isomerase [Marinicella litoralis]TDR22494.1 phosphoribosylanthranilate isomerase [Marinicella litoralis]